MHKSYNSAFKLYQTSFPLIFPVQWQSIRLIRKRCSLLVQVGFLSPFHIRFFDMHGLGMLVASGRKSQMAIACRALLLHAFYPFTQNKINSKFFSCWTVKTEKTCIYMSAKIYLRRTKLIPPFLLISFTFNLVVEYNFM